MPLRRVPHSPALRRAQLSAEVQRKTLRPDRANPPARFKYPAQPVLKKVPPVRVNRLRGSSTPLSRCRKRCRPSGTNTPAAVRVPHSAGAEKNSRPSGANPPAAVRVPRSAGAEKGCRPERMNRLRGSSAPEGRCRKQKNSTLFRVLLGITNAYAFLINASRRSRPLSISVSEVA